MRIVPKGDLRVPIKSKDQCTLVVGVDRKHLAQLKMVWPTWARHKPSLLKMPMLMFVDRYEVPRAVAQSSINHPRLRVCSWPPDDEVDYREFAVDDDDLRWTHPQRYKMLSGFVHVPAKYVETPYFLKLDTDVVATGKDDWIDKAWFAESPAIVAHRWGYTKPFDQMLKLDAWVAKNKGDMGFLAGKAPLNIMPDSDGVRASHGRIISWCGFFRTEFSQWASKLCEATCGPGQLPVPSQDGVLWYLAKRAELPIVTTNMKKLGWQQWHAQRNIVKYSKEAMA